MTPWTASAFELSIEVILAWAYGLCISIACAVRGGSGMSSENCAMPVRRASESTLGVACPTYFMVSAMVEISPGLSLDKMVGGVCHRVPQMVVIAASADIA